MSGKEIEIRGENRTLLEAHPPIIDKVKLITTRDAGHSANDLTT
jgi:hypothetical protein